ncbi:uncharacterized protein [Amphiura filiformis]|uniref:uncharacterized protein n=1 Tax=Amphiura filiformis TaxID=82378 RepID=UPI003B20FC7F
MTMALGTSIRIICQGQGRSTRALFILYKPQFASILQHIDRTSPSCWLQRFTLIHKFHSSPRLKVPRGLRSPSSVLVKASRLDGHQAGSDEQRERELVSKDVGLTGTYIMDRQSNLTSKKDGGQVDLLINESSEQLWFAEDEDYDNEVYMYNDEMKKRKPNRSSSVDTQLDESSDRDYMEMERTKRQNSQQNRYEKMRGDKRQWIHRAQDDSSVSRQKLPQKREERREDKQQWIDKSWGTQDDSSVSRQKLPQKREETKGYKQQWVDNPWVTQSDDDGKNMSRTMDASSEARRITVPKESNAFPFPKSDDLPRDKTTQRRSRNEKSGWKEKRGRHDLSPETERQWVDDSWFAEKSVDGDESGNMGENKAHRTSSPSTSSSVIEHGDSDDLLQVDEEWTSQRRSKQEFGNEGWKKRQESKRMEKRKKQHEKRSILQDVPAAGNEILFGIAPCWLALQRARRVIHRAFITPSFQESDRNEARSILAALENQFDMKVVHRNELDRLTGQRPHQGVCLETSPLEVFTLSDREDVLGAQLESFHQQQQQQAESAQHHPVWLALDQVKDPMNFGAVLRSSYFLGVDRVITCVGNSCPLSPVVSKASSGVMELLEVYAAYDIPLVLQSMSSHGWQVIGACSSTFAAANQEGIEHVPCHQFTLTKPTVLVVGNEGYGLRSKVRTVCSKFLTIEPGRELHPGIDSLNVSVATGILLHSLLGTRK